MSKFMNRFLKDESGATAIEYGLIAALIAVVLITAMSALSGKIGGLFDSIGSELDAAGGGGGGGGEG
ncbi:MAG: Flp family type IVb pilin [Phenylobacterium sp.]|uniref:Flp family type IVb pilin n=1 Tax=Phenylobacterium sp. TaxID=1871053 RepID=UPI00391A567E